MQRLSESPVRSQGSSTRCDRPAGAPQQRGAGAFPPSAPWTELSFLGISFLYQPRGFEPASLAPQERGLTTGSWVGSHHWIWAGLGAGLEPRVASQQHKMEHD